MGRAAAMRIFLSFAGEDGAWVENFVYDDWFRKHVQPSSLVDYRRYGDGLPFGTLSSWISDQIQEADCFIAFLSNYYVAKDQTIKEFDEALAKYKKESVAAPAARPRFLIVPVFMDDKAELWWLNKIENSPLPSDYQYSNFRHNGQRMSIIAKNGYNIDAVTGQITQLAHEIRAHFSPANLSTPQAPAPPVHVVLGHPSGQLPPDIKAHSDDLLRLLRNQLPVDAWPDGWRSSQFTPAALNAGCVFVQPLTEVDAEDHRADSGLTTRNLARKGRTLSDTVVLWLPGSAADSLFKGGDAAQLASALIASTIGVAGMAPAKILREECGEEGAHDLRKVLIDEFPQIVRQIMEPPAEIWGFEGELLEQQLKNLDSNRAIVAVHDLNLPVSQSLPSARTQMEQKMEGIKRRVTNAMNELKRSDIAVFWLAVVINNAEHLPFARWPTPSSYEDWSVLKFDRSHHPAKGSPVLQANQATVNQLRVALSDWLS